MPATTSSPIAHVATTFLPVQDQARALAFFRDTLGFKVRTNVEFGEAEAWIEVAPPGSQASIALNGPSQWGGDGPRPGATAGFGFHVDDLDVTIAELEGRGVEFEDVMRGGGPVPPMAFFRDSEGNRLLVVQRAD
ncbi:MAG: glyoxalase [Thermoleophilia bacterium]|nr:glyoxalase [Thermoleophilia bacterium]